MITCLICKKELKQLHQHLKKAHNITVCEYRSIYNYNGKLQYVSNEDKQKRSLIAKSGGSILSVTYWTKKGYSIEEAKRNISKIQSNNNSKRNYSAKEIIINTEYWIQKHGYSYDEAVKKVSEIQASRSRKSSKFTGKNHSDISKQSISVSMSKHIKTVGSTKWVSHFGVFGGQSKAEIECYETIKKEICNDIQANVSVDKYVVDMIYKTYVIEFNGDYWHANPSIYEDEYFNQTVKKYAKEIRQNDLDRISNLHILGYNVFTIWESDWKKNRLLVLEQVKKFINDI